MMKILLALREAQVELCDVIFDALTLKKNTPHDLGEGCF